MATIDLSGVVNSLGTIFGNTSATTATSAMQTIVQNVALGAVSAAVLKALQHPDVASALNPLGLTIPGMTPTPAAPVATVPAAPVATVPVKTLTMAQVLALGTTVAGAEAAGYIVAG